METHNSRPLQKLGSILKVRTDIRKRWGIVSVAFIIHLILPNLILSYGTIFLMKLDNGDLAHELILAPCIFITTSTFFEPFFREASETWASKIGTRLLSVFGVILVFLGLLSNAFIQSPILYSLPFGLLGGFGSCIITSQIKYIMSDIFYTDVGLIQSFYNAGESIGQFVMPYIILLTFNHYGNQMGFMALSCVTLQLLPISLFVKNNVVAKSIPNLQFGNYSRTYRSFDEDNDTRDIQLMHLSMKTWKSPSDENLSANAVDVLENEPDVARFEILPQIPEECEEPDSDVDSDKIPDYSNHDPIDNEIKRMSVISDKLEILITNTLNESSEKNDDIQPSNTTKAESDNNVILREILAENKRYSRNFNSKIKCCFSSYDIYRFKRRCRNNWDYVSDSLFVPLGRSLKTWQFYPALLVQICAIFVPLGIFCLLPYVAKTTVPELSVNDAVFLLPMHALGWLSFLVTSPWIIHISKSKYKHFVIAGFFMSAVALFVTMETTHYYVLLLLSWFIGISNGMIALTYKEVLKESIGVSKWSKIRDTLDRITALLLIPLTFWIKYLLEMHTALMCLGFFSTLQGFACVVISIIPIVTAVKNSKLMWPGI